MAAFYQEIVLCMDQRLWAMNKTFFSIRIVSLKTAKQTCMLSIDWPLRLVTPFFAMHACLANFKWTNSIAENVSVITHNLWSIIILVQRQNNFPMDSSRWKVLSLKICKTTHTSHLAGFLQQSLFQETENQHANVKPYQFHSLMPTDLLHSSIWERWHYPHPSPIVLNRGLLSE